MTHAWNSTKKIPLTERWQWRRWLQGDKSKEKLGMRQSRGLLDCFLVMDCIARFYWRKRSPAIEWHWLDWANWFCSQVYCCRNKAVFIFSLAVWSPEITKILVSDDTNTKKKTTHSTHIFTYWHKAKSSSHFLTVLSISLLLWLIANLRYELHAKDSCMPGTIRNCRKILKTVQH